MRFVIHYSSALLLIAVGYILGSNDVFLPSGLRAQDVEPSAAGDEPSEENQEKIREAYAALKSAATALAGDNNMYKSASIGVNGFAVTVGGVDALADLEAGRGVDPETFAALYAGMGIDEVVEHLGKDDQGRLTYKDKVIRMYPISRLRQLYSRRIKYSGEETTVDGVLK